MKKLIFILSLCLASIFTISAQDTLKFKTIKTDYGYMEGGYFHDLGKLDGTMINIDTFTVLTPQLHVVNISNENVSSDIMIESTMDFLLYDDTGLLLVEDRNISQKHPLGELLSINDTVRLVFMGFPLLDIIDYLEGIGINFERISYWKLIAGISYTSQDGKYSDSIFYAGADTSTFRIVKTPVSILETTQAEISVFPNPAQSHFTVTNTENANLTLYNILGQKVKQVVGEGENTVIYTEDLPQGIYLLKVEKGDAVLTKKIQISN